MVVEDLTEPKAEEVSSNQPDVAIHKKTFTLESILIFVHNIV